MARYVLRRLLTFIPVLFVIVTVVFFLIRLAPGGPFDTEREFPQDVQRQLNEYYGQNLPLYQQYWNYLSSAVHGDLGRSLTQPRFTVTEWIALRFRVSLELGLYALALALAIGLSAGMLAALKPNTFWDYAPMSLAMVGICLPTFVLGPILVWLFPIQLGMLSEAGWRYPSDKVLPSITLGVAFAAYIARLSRGGLLEVLSQDFIRTARAKGLGETRILLRHALRGGLQPVVTYLGPAAAGLLTGSFVVETIFNVPGLGREFIKAALDRDYTMIMGTVLFFAMLILVFNLVVDIVVAWLDPRLRHSLQ